uniref:ATP synthase F0 subunit 6 n=1 Tax=Spinactaletes boneti TaxID=2736147 RepID=UPI001EDCEC4B|nr:ATP synthase F0 subunit 6 [Spinactaletes boneti]UJY98020.1 ATP synthase F0 subunit 6 [Spinactaletes boneti]
MMTNLFSVFDPASSLIIPLNWLSSIMFFITMPIMFWVIPSKSMILFNKITTTLHNEFKMLLGQENIKGLTIMMISLFIFILMNNFMGLFPYVFTSTSHLTTTLTLSMPLWVSFMIFGWLNNTNHMFAHLVPQSTPGPLMPFMVLIETISNVIRPGTLAVRLTANMIAGHLLMSLLGNKTAETMNILIIGLLITQILLLVLESAVAIIQSYVFAVLTTLYSSEVMSH